MSDVLKKAAFEVTRLVLDKKHIHMKKLWEMVLGGLIIPVIAEGNADLIEKNPEFKNLMERYNKKAIKRFLKEAPKETIIEKKVEVIVPVDDNESLFRRLKDDGIKKISRKKRELNVIERNAIIEWWNNNQRMIDKNDPVCAEIVDQLHPDGSRPISPLQIAGFFSLICRKGLKVEGERSEYWNKRLSEGNINLTPIYSEEGLKTIQNIWKLNRKEEAAIEKDHIELRDRRKEGDNTPLKVARIKKVDSVILRTDNHVVDETSSSVEPVSETTGAMIVPEHIITKTTTESATLTPIKDDEEIEITFA